MRSMNMSLLNGKSIKIYGKPGSYKTTISNLLQTAISNKGYYLDLENNIYTINDIIKYLSLYDVVVVDYIELLQTNIDDIKILKYYIKNKNKILLMVSYCSSNKDIFENCNKNNNDLYDLTIITTKKELLWLQ